MAPRRNLRILVVDDMAISRQILTQMLEQIGVETVVTAVNGQSVMDTLQAQPVDIVISDLNMPGLCGLDLLRNLRAHQKFRHLRYVLASGDDTDPRIQIAWEEGIDYFLPKPFDILHLNRCLETVVGRI